MDAGTWVAVAFSAISMVGTVLSASNARRVARDKLEFERAAARDKLEFDAKTRGLEVQLALVQGELVGCREQHKASEAAHKASEANQVELRGEINDLRALVTKLQGKP